jgi:hypothetical protein
MHQGIRVGEAGLIDLYEPQEVEISIRSDGNVVWINIDGICHIRAIRPQNIAIDDRRLTAQ